MGKVVGIDQGRAKKRTERTRKRPLVTGDITQVDLPTGTSGLRLVTQVLADVDDIHFARLTSEDVVRHTLVGRIVDAYTKYDELKQARHVSPDAVGGNRAERRGRPPQDRKKGQR